MRIRQAQLLIKRRRSRERLFDYYPETGPRRRELYAKHLEFFEAGARYKERLAMCANQVGKTEGMNCYETTLHLTGLYPGWWRGYRFDRQVSWIAAGKTSTTTRDVLQQRLFGNVIWLNGSTRGFSGTGMVPGDMIGEINWRRGVADAADTVKVRHKSGGWSVLALKSYEQGRQAFEGEVRDGVSLDEEPPFDVYEEARMRTITTGGPVILTFTPLDGITEVVDSFLPGLDIGEVPGSEGSKYVVRAGWRDVPHISEEEQRIQLAGCRPYLRKARSEGYPSMESGVIYPIDDAAITHQPFAIPDHYRRIAGIDFGSTHAFAAGWLAEDPDSGTVYLTDEYWQCEERVPVHAAALRSRGDWIPIAWPRDGDNETLAGQALSKQFVDHGCNMLVESARMEQVPGEPLGSVFSVSAGCDLIFDAMQTGRFKVFSTCQRFFHEKNRYRRDAKGKIVKVHDDLMDAVRYAFVSLRYAERMPVAKSRGASRPALRF